MVQDPNWLDRDCTQCSIQEREIFPGFAVDSCGPVRIRLGLGWLFGRGPGDARTDNIRVELQVQSY